MEGWVYLRKKVTNKVNKKVWPKKVYQNNSDWEESPVEEGQHETLDDEEAEGHEQDQLLQADLRHRQKLKRWNLRDDELENWKLKFDF